jgi:putative ABC transport system ATP-binding protein
MIRLENVSKSYESGTAAVSPLKEVSIHIKSGERIILLGKSGSGKTTFLNIIGGVDRPSAGRVLFEGVDLARMPADRLAHYRRKEVGFVFQSFNLFATLTVGENVMLPLELLGETDENKAKSLLDSIGLADQWDKFPEQLSGGEQQRVAIARALVKKPRLLLADEPTGNLDNDTGLEILKMIHQICLERATTLVLVTHSNDALWIADRILRIKSGTLENGA